MNEMDRVQERAERQLAALEAVQRRLDSIRVRETGDRDRVCVEVDGSGALVALELRPGVGDGRPAVIADAIVGTAVRAASRAFAERGDVMAAFVAEFESLTGVSPEPGEGSARQTWQEHRS